ncbi:MAG: polysaccharide deacetylase [Candidatus Eremiobacteraeota bacterium]|nr:polysaccharide deacetylase [Candidatus Eremiobacteraeota bacterium]
MNPPERSFLSHGPMEYVPAPARRLEPFPGDARLALHVIVNVETWEFQGPMPRTALPPPASGGTVPDVPNFAWYQYGQRVGIWRLFETLQRHGVRATLSVNSSACSEYPEIIGRAVADEWEMMPHGVVQRTMSSVEDERAVINEAIAHLESATGTRPRGWLGPALVETTQTLDLLAEAGFDYCCDWGPADDVPYDLRVANGRRMVAVPYPIELNDIVVYAVERHSAEEFFTRCTAAFDQLYAESKTSPKVLPIALHPYLTGTPSRIAALDRILEYVLKRKKVRAMTAAEIADWYIAQTPQASS